ncbi:hypothetical protein EKH57_11205 [Halorubrum sp. BOL3-1]|uniref:hypothetical protein n=1 Tax=Halorubrum sp. BOL3-1 TaxID=2497325 RepID=UPI001004EC2A|nr:hypothetical protein [Halorubrum sp. BOL3-1]QAU13246.1 hypothetical protein EKH57_11205 [Halorubrum sp. BOL3-1]
MSLYVLITAIGAVVVTVLMVTAMLYLVWGAIDDDTHAPSPGDDPEDPELAEGSESGETQGELPPDGDAT